MVWLKKEVCYDSCVRTEMEYEEDKDVNCDSDLLCFFLIIIVSYVREVMQVVVLELLTKQNASIVIFNSFTLHNKYNVQLTCK